VRSFWSGFRISTRLISGLQTLEGESGEESNNY